MLLSVGLSAAKAYLPTPEGGLLGAFLSVEKDPTGKNVQVTSYSPHRVRALLSIPQKMRI